MTKEEIELAKSVLDHKQIIAVRAIARSEAMTVVWEHEQIIEPINVINKLGHQMRELEKRIENLEKKLRS